MPRTGLTPEEMREAALDATETVIRRFGAARTRMTDIAKEIGVNHAVLYRHFPDKASLLDAVSQRWLDRMEASLDAIATGPGTPDGRLAEWFLALHRAKRQKMSADPELYCAFAATGKERPVVIEHIAVMTAQVRGLIAEAMEAGRFAAGDPDAVMEMLFAATTAFHQPTLVLEHVEQDREPLLRRLLDALLAGLRA